MSSFICLPNKAAAPGSGVCTEFALAAAKDEGIDLMGASCPSDPGNEAVGECGKRLSDSLWASEDLSCRSEIRGDAPASRGSPEWTGAVDSQRAISLDASECMSEMSSLSLVRSTALEDLTSIGGRKSWVNQGEETTSEAKDDVSADGAALKSCSHSGSRNMSPETQQPPFTPNPSHPSIFGSRSEETHSSRNISEKDRPFPKTTSGTEAEHSGLSDSSLHRAGCSQPDFSNDSDMGGRVAQTTSAPELQKTPRQGSPARKSLVPVPVVKGLFAVMFTSSEPSSVNSSHLFLLQRSFYCVLCCTLPPSPFSGH